jgi:hypothetical protein
MIRQRETVRVLCGLILCGLMTGCSDNASPTGPSGAPSSPSFPQVVDRTFTLPLNGAASVNDGALELTFRRVVKDERCGSAALCIAGRVFEATLEFEFIIRQAGGLARSSTMQLSTDTRNSARIGDYTVSLQLLAPYPISSSQPINADDYRVTVRITSAQS